MEISGRHVERPGWKANSRLSVTIPSISSATQPIHSSLFYAAISEKITNNYKNN